MLLLITIITYLLCYIFDYNKIKREQSKKQNILYMLLFLFSFLLSIAYVFDFPIPKVSQILRAVIGK